MSSTKLHTTSALALAAFILSSQAASSTNVAPSNQGKQSAIENTQRNLQPSAAQLDESFFTEDEKSILRKQREAFLRKQREASLREQREDAIQQCETRLKTLRGKEGLFVAKKSFFSKDKEFMERKKRYYIQNLNKLENEYRAKKILLRNTETAYPDHESPELKIQRYKQTCQNDANALADFIYWATNTTPPGGFDSKYGNQQQVDHFFMNKLKEFEKQQKN